MEARGQPRRTIDAADETRQNYTSGTYVRAPCHTKLSPVVCPPGVSCLKAGGQAEDDGEDDDDDEDDGEPVPGREVEEEEEEEEEAAADEAAAEPEPEGMGGKEVAAAIAGSGPGPEEEAGTEPASEYEIQWLRETNQIH